MHHALLLPEVVNGIADSFDISAPHVPPRLVAERRISLRAMMTTNRMFSDAALDKLWPICDPCDLARLMPSGWWYEEAHDKQTWRIMRKPTDEDWEAGNTRRASAL
jgi:hypothetical protein